VFAVVHDDREDVMHSYDEEPADVSYRDYDEEAIPERDPDYRLPHGTGDEHPTVEAMSAELIHELACRLQNLGMSQARAAAVVSLC
jgi:hypothetical protein